MVCVYYWIFDVFRLYWCVFYVLLFIVESYYLGDVESIVVGIDDAFECDGDVVYRYVDVVWVGYCFYFVGFVWWWYCIGVF